jgi:hypothetical protein
MAESAKIRIGVLPYWQILVFMSIFIIPDSQRILNKVNKVVVLWISSAIKVGKTGNKVSLV